MLKQFVTTILGSVLLGFMALGDVLPKVALDGRELKVETARCSAMPVNIRWPGHQRELDQTEICTFVRFDLSKPVALTVTAPADSRKAVIRPLSKKVAFTRSGNALSFTLKEPGASFADYVTVAKTYWSVRKNLLEAVGR